MKLVWIGMLLLSWPCTLLAQSGPAPDRRPPGQKTVRSAPKPAPVGERTDQPADTAPEEPESPAPMAPDDQIIAAPLPPPDQTMGPDEQTEAPQDMVPNPLDTPARPAPGGKSPAKVQTTGGQVRRGAWVQMGTATLQALDKVNARAETLAVKSGDSGRFGSLDIAVKGCVVRPSDQPADAAAFLVVRDQRGEKPVFSGWVVRSAPYMSMLAHPIYDIRVAGCAP